MRIALVADNYPPDLGGIQVVVGELARGMASRGHHVEVFAHAGRGAAAETARQDGVVVHRFRVPVPARDLHVAPGMLVALRRRRRQFDVVHAHNFHALPALGAAVAGMRPLVFTPYYHGAGHSRSARMAHIVYRPATRILFRACAHIACVSAAEARALTLDFPDIASPVSVVSAGVDITSFQGVAPFGSKTDIVLVVGRIEPYKQFDRVALAAKFLPRGTRVVMVGDGSARPSIERLVQQHGLEERVGFVGRASDEDLHRWFSTASVLVSMSRHESFGLTVVEALAAGVPVVASDIPAHRETAEMQPPGAVRVLPLDAEPELIAENIIAAKRDGLPHGVRVSSWRDMTAKMLEIYASVLRAAPSSRSSSTSR